MTDSRESRNRPRPTLKTIAEETGFAVATVSRALKDAPDIGETTKKRVRAVAAELGYHPNRAGVRLRTGKTNVIALVLSAEGHVMLHTSRLIFVMSQTLRATPYHLVVTPVAQDADPMEPIRYVVESGSADGIVFAQTEKDDPRALYLLERGIPFATHGRTGMDDRHPSYDFDNESFARLAVEQLVKRGRRDLLLIGPPRHHFYAVHTHNGFTAWPRMRHPTAI